MSKIEDVLREAMPDVPPRPSVDQLMRRADARRRSRRILGAVPLVVVGLVVAVVVSGRDGSSDTGVVASDPLAAALAQYDREVEVAPATGDVAVTAPSGGVDVGREVVEGTLDVVGRLEGGAVLATYTARGGALEGEARCLMVDSHTVGCEPARVREEPSTSAIDGHIVWTNVPRNAVAVGLVAMDGSRWARPVGQFAYFPVEGHAWHRFEIKAFSRTGAVLASEEFVSGEGGRLRWITADGRLMERVNKGEESTVRQLADRAQTGRTRRRD